MKISDIKLIAEPQKVLVVRKITDNKRTVYSKLSEEKTAEQIDASIARFKAVSHFEPAKSYITLHPELFKKANDCLEGKFSKAYCECKLTSLEGTEGVFIRLNKKTLKNYYTMMFQTINNIIIDSLGTADGLGDACERPGYTRFILSNMLLEKQGLWIVEMSASGDEAFPMDRWIDRAYEEMTAGDGIEGFVYKVEALFDYKVESIDADTLAKAIASGRIKTVMSGPKDLLLEIEDEDLEDDEEEDEDE